MSFSKDIKKEILSNGFKGRCSGLAFLCGLIYSSAEYEVEENIVKNFVIPTDLDFLIDYLKNITKELYGRDDLNLSSTFKISTTQYYNIAFPSDLALKILLETRALKLEDGILQLNEKVSGEITKDIDG